MKAKEGMRVCPVCQTTMERTIRKCVNPDCRVSLKAAEKEVQGTDVLGTALVAPVRQYRHRVKKTQYGFDIDYNEERHVLSKKISQNATMNFNMLPQIILIIKLKFLQVTLCL